MYVSLCTVSQKTKHSWFPTAILLVKTSMQAYICQKLINAHPEVSSRYSHIHSLSFTDMHAHTPSHNSYETWLAFLLHAYNVYLQCFCLNANINMRLDFEVFLNICCIALAPVANIQEAWQYFHWVGFDFIHLL